MAEAPRTLRFGDFELDPGAMELRREGLRVEIHDRPLRLLILLVERRGQTVTKDEIFETVWPGATVTESSITSALTQLRAALDDRREAHWVRTIRGEGLRFVGRVEEAKSEADAAAEEPAPASRWRLPTSAAAIALTLLAIAWGLDTAAPPEVVRRSIVVMPFENLSPNADEQHLADGFAWELNRALGRLPGLRVILPTSARHFADQPPQAVRDALGIDALVRGSLRSSPDELRVTVQIVDADGEQLWSESFREPRDAVFELQDQVALQVGRALRVKMEAPGRPTHPGNFRSWEYLQISRRAYLDGGYDNIQRAMKYNQLALEADPESPAPHSALAFGYAFLYDLGDPEGYAILEKGWYHSRRALELDPGWWEGHGSVGILHESEKEWDEAAAAYDRSIELAGGVGLGPTIDRAHLAMTLGELGFAREYYDRALELDPFNPVVNYYTAMVMLFQGETDRAIELLERTRDIGWIDPLGRRDSYLLERAYAAAGRDEEAFRTSLPSDVPAQVTEALEAAFAAGGLAEARRLRLALLAERENDHPCGHGYWFAAEEWASLGETEHMYTCLEEGVRVWGPEGWRYPYILVSTDFAAYRSEPRMHAIIEAMGFPVPGS